MDYALQTRDLRKSFGPLVAVDGIDLAVPRGSFYGFLGPNGAGKSTTIKCITGLLRPSAGAIRILETDALADPVAVKRKIGVVPEDLALFERLSGAETLAFVGQVYGLDAGTLRARSRELLDVMSLSAAAGDLVADYSHGMRKKLALSAALLPAPRMLFLDEPFEGIDAIASRQIKEILVQFVARGGTVFLTSHILEIIERLCDHLGVIHKGKLVAQGPLRELRAGVGLGSDVQKSVETLFLELVGAEEQRAPALEWLGLMLRVAWIFARVRWRMLYNGLAKSKKRDGLERVSRITKVAMPAILFVFMLGLALLLAVGAWFLAAALVATPLRAPQLLLPLRLLLFSLMLMIALLPSSASKQGALATSTRVHLLPIARGVLHKVEVLSALGNPWLAFVVPALLALCASFAVHGRADLALFAAALGAAFVALLAVLSTLASLIASWMFKSRRRTEALTLIFVLVFSVAGLFPLFIGEGIEDGLRDSAKRNGPGAFARELEEFDLGRPWYVRALPTELYASTLRHALGGRSDAAWTCVALLCAEVLALYLVSGLAHARLSQPTGGEASRRRERTAVRAWWRVPGLSPASSAVAHAQVRSVLRSVRGRVIVLMPGPLVAALGLLTRAAPEEFPLGDMFSTRGHMMLGAGLVFSQYALLAVTMNQFASDRAGLTLQFLAPVSEREIVLGKALACVLIGSVAAAICALACALTMSVASPLSWLSVLLGGLATALLVQPFGVLCSAALPVAADLSKTGSGGNPHGLAFFLGTLLVMALSAPTALILSYVDHLLQRPALALLLVAAWTACAALIAFFVLGIAAGALASRRENVGLVAQGR